jgi:signal transduction histidine kinase
MLLLGLVGFIFTCILVLLGFYNNIDNLSPLIPYGIIILITNVFYLKLIRLSRADYEAKLQKEKLYSQELLKAHKLFLRNAVHEINTPISIIMANIELYELEYGKNTILSNIEAATKNIYGIYDDLSYLTKKDKLDYKKDTIILSDFIQNRIDFFKILAQQSNLTFHYFKNIENPDKIYINETKLQRIIDNNITNAIKYTQELGTIIIRVYETESHFVFEISSNSTIIKEPESVFNAYKRENSVKDGFGLGLNLVKTICDEEKIQIELISDEKITKFKYYFTKESDENITTGG